MLIFSGTSPNVVRRRNFKVQDSENFSLALEAVRSGSLGFCKAAKIYGLNNRTLWLEYKKRGYPTIRPPVNAKHKNSLSSSTSWFVMYTMVFIKLICAKHSDYGILTVKVPKLCTHCTQQCLETINLNSSNFYESFLYICITVLLVEINISFLINRKFLIHYLLLVF